MPRGQEALPQKNQELNNEASIQLSPTARFILIINQKLSSVEFQEIEQYPDEEKVPLKIKQ